MNLIDIVKNAPEGAERYRVFDSGRGADYYATINGVNTFYSFSSKRWSGCRSSGFDSSLPLPKLKTEYRKVEDSIWYLRPDFEAGELYYRDTLINNEEYKTSYQVIRSEGRLLKAALSKDIYRRVESIMDEREEFSVKFNKLRDEWDSSDDYDDKTTLSRFLYEKGCRFID